MKITRHEAASYGGPIAPQTRFLREPEGTEVIVEVSHCGVCHTDVHVHHGSYDLGGGRILSFSARGIEPPLVLGHEIVGRPVAAGPNATGVRFGDPHLVYPWIGCGACRSCAAARDHLCAEGAFLGVFRPGGYASHVAIPHPRYLLPLDGLDPASSALFGCSGLTCFNALQQVSQRPDGAALLVVGCGGLGLTAIALAQQLGWEHIVATDPDPEKRHLAEAAGVRAALDPQGLDAASLQDAAGTPIAAALDFVGSPSTSALAIAGLAKGGSLSIIGLFGGELRHPLPLFPIRALTIHGVYVGSPGALRDYMAHVRRHGAPAIPIEEHPMTAAGKVLSALERGEIAGRAVLVNPRRGELETEEKTT